MLQSHLLRIDRSSLKMRSANKNSTYTLHTNLNRSYNFNRNNNRSIADKWSHINQIALTRRLSSAPKIKTNIENLKAMKFNESINYLNTAIADGYVLSIAEFEIILTKYHQDYLTSDLLDDVVFLFRMVYLIYPLETNDLSEFQRLYMEFFIKHQKQFGNDQIIPIAELIFNTYENKKTFSALLHAYQEDNQNDRVCQLFEEYKDKYQWNKINEWYLWSLYRSCGFDEAIRYYDQLFIQSNSASNDELLNTHCIRVMLQLFQIEIGKVVEDKRELLLNKMIQYYNQIPAVLRVDQVNRVLMKTLCDFDSVERGYLFFKDLIKNKIILLDHTYNEILNRLFEVGKLNEAMQALVIAFENNTFLQNKAKFKIDSRFDVVIDLHLDTTTGSGVPIHSGTRKNFLSCAIACMFKEIQTYYKDADIKPSDEIKIKIITGKGKGINKQRVYDIFHDTFNKKPLNNEFFESEGQLIYNFNLTYMKDDEEFKKYITPVVLPETELPKQIAKINTKKIIIHKMRVLPNLNNKHFNDKNDSLTKVSESKSVLFQNQDSDNTNNTQIQSEEHKQTSSPGRL